MLHRLRLLAIVGVLLLSTVARARSPQPWLDALDDLPETPRRYVENIKMGLRGVTFTNFAQAPSDGKTIYVVAQDGYVYATHDGGHSWNEGRLISKRILVTVGALRPSPAPNGAPFNLAESLRPVGKGTWLHSAVLPAYNPFELLLFPDASVYAPPPGAVGVPNLPGLGNDDSPDYGPFGADPDFLGFDGRGVPFSTKLLQFYDYDPLLRPFGFSDSSGAGGNDGDAARLGVGLEVAAPRLGALLAKKKRKPPTMNLKRALVEKGVEPTYVAHIAIHPENPNVAFAASRMGLFRSDDGGISWQLVFFGTNKWERDAVAVELDPADPNRVFLATGQGLRISGDGGRSFVPPSGTQLSSARSHWIDFHEADPQIIWVGTNIGAFRSDDGGQSFEWAFFETLAQQNDITGVVINPADPERVTLGTADGLYQSEDRGETWRRAGGLVFTGTRIQRLAGSQVDGDRLACVTWRGVWESRDGGKNWTTTYVNDSDWWFRSLFFDGFDPETLWVLTSAEILQISPRPPEESDPGGIQRIRERVAAEPDLAASLAAAFRALGVHRGERGIVRARAGLQALLPKLNIVVGRRWLASDAYDQPTVLADFYQENIFDKRVRRPDPYYAVVANWDLNDLIFHQEEAPFGRTFSDANQAYLQVRSEVQRLYEERRRLLIELLGQPALDFPSQLLLRLRLEELTAHLTGLTDGLWDEPLAWVESLE